MAFALLLGCSQGMVSTGGGIRLQAVVAEAAAIVVGWLGIVVPGVPEISESLMARGDGTISGDMAERRAHVSTLGGCDLISEGSWSLFSGTSKGSLVEGRGG